MKFSSLITVEFVKLPVNTNWNSLSLHGVGWHSFPESTTSVWVTSKNVNGLENRSGTVGPDCKQFMAVVCAFLWVVKGNRLHCLPIVNLSV